MTVDHPGFAPCPPPAILPTRRPHRRPAATPAVHPTHALYPSAPPRPLRARARPPAVQHRVHPPAPAADAPHGPRSSRRHVRPPRQRRRGQCRRRRPAVAAGRHGRPRRRPRRARPGAGRAGDPRPRRQLRRPGRGVAGLGHARRHRRVPPARPVRRRARRQHARAPRPVGGSEPGHRDRPQRARRTPARARARRPGDGRARPAPPARRRPGGHRLHGHLHARRRLAARGAGPARGVPAPSGPRCHPARRRRRPGRHARRGRGPADRGHPPDARANGLPGLPAVVYPGARLGHRHRAAVRLRLYPHQERHQAPRLRGGRPGRGLQRRAGLCRHGARRRDRARRPERAAGLGRRARYPGRRPWPARADRRRGAGLPAARAHAGGARRGLGRGLHDAAGGVGSGADASSERGSGRRRTAVRPRPARGRADRRGTGCRRGRRPLSDRRRGHPAPPLGADAGPRSRAGRLPAPVVRRRARCAWPSCTSTGTAARPARWRARTCG